MRYLIVGVVLGALIGFGLSPALSIGKSVVGKKITYINKRTGSVKVMMCKQVK
jgi:hypothetical protein